MIERLAVIGVGLIGGSLALAAKQAGLAQHVTGIEADAASAAAALDLGVVDAIATAVPQEADLIAICVPSDRVGAAVATIAAHAAPCFDVSSVKQPVVEQVQAACGDWPTRFIPCHPIAGSERSGPQAARADLFADAMVVLTPLADSEADALAVVEGFWQGLGTHTATLGAAEHDAMLALTSHLPHLLAFAFMQQVAADDLPFTGGGFRDFSRIAAANPELWWRILQLNKPALLKVLGRFQQDLSALADALQVDDVDQGVAMLEQARRLRDQLDA